jgi:hypothetical protein
MSSITNLLLEDNKALRAMIAKRDRETYAVLQQAASARDDGIKSTDSEVLLLKNELNKALEMIATAQAEKQHLENIAQKQQKELGMLRATIEKLSHESADASLREKHLSEQQKVIAPRYEEFRRLATEREVEASLLREKLESESRALRLIRQKLDELQDRNQKLENERENTADVQFEISKHFEQLLEDRAKQIAQTRLENEQLKHTAR